MVDQIRRRAEWVFVAIAAMCLIELADGPEPDGCILLAITNVPSYDSYLPCRLRATGLYLLAFTDAEGGHESVEIRSSCVWVGVIRVSGTR